MRRPILVTLAISMVAGLVPAAGIAVAQTSPQLAADGREVEPVVLTGASFDRWAVPADVPVKGNSIDGARCQGKREFGQDPAAYVPGAVREGAGLREDPCSHNEYERPDVSTQDHLQQSGVDIDQILGYRWDGDSFEQIPFQVDEMFARYLSNNNSGFAFYSETDYHHSYAFDREGFRWTASDPNNPCLAAPASAVAKDPVQGLDTDDELVFMTRDTGGRAPSTAALPYGIQDSYEVAVTDPTRPGAVGFVYVMRSSDVGPRAAFDETNGYVSYERDEDADVFLYSQSSYGDYGAAPHGPWYDPSTGVCHTDPAEWKQRRPSDQAWVSTPRYRFRYDGRWLMTQLQVNNADDGRAIAPTGNEAYGLDLIDQWKARAFQQRPSGKTPCCGYEEEVNNWGGSSQLMGELAGPVRVIRETWGADSGTNVVRREIFYRDEIRFGAFLRVHVIPPGDGIYAQWDYNAGIIDTYRNPFRPDGVPVDGQNDEVFGNHRVEVGPGGATFEDGNGNDFSTGTYEGSPCSQTAIPPQYWDRFPEQFRDGVGDACVYNDIDSPDPTFSGVNAGLNWEQLSGEQGTVVTRTGIKHFTPGGTVQALAAVPYYRDDSCFDDGTGSNPGPHLDPRSADDVEYNSDGTIRKDHTAWNGEPRRCWKPSDGVPPAEGDPRFWQGSIGTHGQHILLIADSDNAHTTLPITEIDTEQRMVVLTGRRGNVGDTYGRHTEKPLVAATLYEPADARPRSEKPGPETQATTVEIVGATSGQATDQAELAARLMTAGGEPVEGAGITFRLDGSNVGTATTDASGVARLTTTLAPPARAAQLEALFDGSEGLEPSSATTEFKIELEDTKLTLQVRRSGAGYTATATLQEADTPPTALADKDIVFRANGTELKARTNTDGTATVTFSRNAVKTGDTITATFGGDATYRTSESSAPAPKN